MMLPKRGRSQKSAERIKWLQARVCSHPYSENALLASTRLPGKMRNIFSLKAWVAPIGADILRL